MENTIYGIDLNKDFNETEVRDALVKCFIEAHGEILNRELDDYSKEIDPQVIGSLKNMNVKMLIENFFKKAGGDFNKPDKKSLEAVMQKLKEFALNFRAGDIVDKHYDEMMLLINKLN